jgi:hypothetical protein
MNVTRRGMFKTSVAARGGGLVASASAELGQFGVDLIARRTSRRSVNRSLDVGAEP